MTKKRPLILAVNDDGITAKGIQAMVEAAQELADVIVVAPDSPQSGMGHAITLNKPLRLTKVDGHGESLSYQCSGTPVDCVKIAIDKVLHRKPDLVISGINHGANHSINVIYSGTMSAAMEGAIEGIPSVGFSLLNYSAKADFTASKHFVKMMIKNLLHFGMPTGTLLNV
ncbi:MAG: 5'-nucleotidase, partial [Bacteroidia bacterium]